jgi:hypothetical protein
MDIEWRGKKIVVCSACRQAIVRIEKEEELADLQKVMPSEISQQEQGEEIVEVIDSATLEEARKGLADKIGEIIETEERKLYL